MTVPTRAPKASLEQLLGSRLADAPLESTLSFTVAMAWAFYRAERGKNPRVRTYWDAFHYIATSLSVGYANIFPTTERGKVIGALVMIVGPAMSAGALERVRAESASRKPGPATDPALLAKLDAILDELRTLRSETSKRTSPAR